MAVRANRKATSLMGRRLKYADLNAYEGVGKGVSS